MVSISRHILAHFLSIIYLQGCGLQYINIGFDGGVKSCPLIDVKRTTLKYYRNVNNTDITHYKLVD